MNLLIRFLREPQLAAAWGAEQWNEFLPLARSAGLLGRCLSLMEQHGLLDVAPQRLVDQLQGALNQTRYVPVSYTHLTLPTNTNACRSRWAREQ